MGDAPVVRKSEDSDWQREVREKIEDLVLAIEHTRANFNSWAIGFIESMSEKLNQKTIHVTPKQYEKIMDLWERI